ncbi:MAG TPA: PLP-dependent aminotransferase family protein [Polyangiaceae bacterium]
MREARIDALQRACAARSDVIGLAGGLPDPSLFPREAMQSALAAVMHDPKLAALQYSWPEGDPSLRAWLAARLSTESCPLDASDVIVTAGAQQAIAIAIDVLAERGASVGVAPASYPAALDLFRTRGLALTDCARASVFYLTPEIGNPEGLPIDEALAARPRAAHAPIIADDAYAELRFDGARTRRPFDTVWRVATFAKTLCPGLRIGCLVPPREHRARALRLKRDADLQASGVGQAALVELLRCFDYDAHLARVRAVYARRASALADAIRAHFPAWKFREPQGGFSIFVDTCTPGDDVALLAAASAHGVSFDPGSAFRARPHETMELRVCYSNASESLLAEGIARLSHAWSSFTARDGDATRRSPARRRKRSPSRCSS